MEKSNTIKSTDLQLSYSVKLCIQLLSFVLIVFILIEGQAIFVPLYLSVLISILLLPVANNLERIHFPRAMAALVSVLISFVIISLIIYLLSAQIISFLNDIPAIKIHLAAHYKTLQNFLEHSLNISLTQQQTLFNSASEGAQSSGLVYAKQTFYTVTQTLAFAIFIIIYSFLLLFYRSTIKSFLMKLFKTKNKKNIEEVLNNAKKILKNYMSGLLIEMAIISTSNAILLMIIDLKYAIFLGVFTGILNIMPFIGIYTGILFTTLVSLTTDASMSQILWMIIGLIIIHFIDANFLMPRIVGAKVKINALMTMLGAIAGGLLMGIAGIFLALPTIAILKIIFDRIEGMEAWAILLGDETNVPSKKIVQTINNKLTIKKKVKG